MRSLLAALAVTIGVSAASPTFAGVYADDLGRCLVRKTSEADRVDLMRWIFGGWMLNPAVKPLANVTADQRTQFAKTAAALFERLMLTDCRTEALDGLKYEGDGVIRDAFKLLGEVAATGLMNDPAVEAELGQISQHLDEAKWEAFIGSAKAK